MLLETPELTFFYHEVKRRARATLGLRGHPNPQRCNLCVIAIDHALTRGYLSELDIVCAARKVADDTQRWR